MGVTAQGHCSSNAIVKIPLDKIHMPVYRMFVYAGLSDITLKYRRQERVEDPLKVLQRQPAVWK